MLRFAVGDNGDDDEVSSTLAIALRAAAAGASGRGEERSGVGCCFKGL